MPWFQTHVVLPFFERDRHRGLSRRLKALAEFESLPELEQRASQARNVSRLLEHAYTTVPYYKQAFEQAGTTPKDWRPGELIPLSVSSRDNLRAESARMTSSAFSADQLEATSTGGTTSTPVQLLRDVEGLRNKVALQYHLDSLAGYHQGDSVLMVWGALRDLELNPSWRWKFYEQTLRRQILAPAGHTSDEVFADFTRKLNRYRPKIIYGYSATIASFAEYLSRQPAKHHHPKSVIITAEAISETEKQTIRTVFQCPVTEHYGSRELGMVAAECGSGNLHFHPAGCLVEFQSQGMTEDGPMDRLILTDLLNYGMPLIRYDTGDFVLRGEGSCACGLWYPYVKKVVGRSFDALILPDGTQVPGLTVVNRLLLLAQGFHSVTQLQVVQKLVDRVVVRYVAKDDGPETQRELGRARSVLDSVFKVPIDVTMERVSDIPRAASGKLRPCISEVPRPQIAASGMQTHAATSAAQAESTQ